VEFLVAELRDLANKNRMPAIGRGSLEDVTQYGKIANRLGHP